MAPPEPRAKKAEKRVSDPSGIALAFACKCKGLPPHSGPASVRLSRQLQDRAIWHAVEALIVSSLTALAEKSVRWVQMELNDHENVNIDK
eukprot:258480-Amphidinium_carterae.1